MNKCPKCGSELKYEPQANIITPVNGKCYAVASYICEKCGYELSTKD
jgi:C4-type Zn-finger protein